MKKKSQSKPKKNPEILEKTTIDDENGMVVNEAASLNHITRGHQPNNLNSDPQI